eukprot:2495172-Pyramimonas_sp.AAC.1
MSDVSVRFRLVELIKIITITKVMLICSRQQQTTIVYAAPPHASAAPRLLAKSGIRRKTRACSSLRHC